MRMHHHLLTPFLCREHLLGAHGELHKFLPSFLKHHSLTGRIYPKPQIEPWRMDRYHAELVKEMERRGYVHRSPYSMPDISYLPPEQRNACLSFENSLEFILGCAGCRKKWRGQQKRVCPTCGGMGGVYVLEKYGRNCIRCEGRGLVNEFGQPYLLEEDKMENYN